MATYGFGPLSTNSTTTRPTVDSDAYGQQTWFKDASAAGAKDGTVITASWLNHVVANLKTLCVNAGIDISNNHAGDTWIYDAVLALISLKLSQSSISSLGSLGDVIDGGSTGDILVKQADGSWRATAQSGSVTDNNDGTYTVVSSNGSSVSVIGAQILEYTLEGTAADADSLLVYSTIGGGLRRMTRATLLGGLVSQDNLTATVDPGVNDDTLAGYSVGSRWINISSGEAFVATSVSAGAAAWRNTSLEASELGAMAFFNAASDAQALAKTSTSVGITPSNLAALFDSFTLGSIPFADATGKLVQDNANFFWDDTNDRLGIATATPEVALDMGNKTDAIELPAGTTAQRPTGAAGRTRWNSTLTRWEYHNGTDWLFIPIQTTQDTAPTDPQLLDEWYQPSTDTLFKRVNDSVSDIWLDITPSGISETIPWGL